MNKVEDNKINEYIKQKYEELVEQYSYNNILGVFAIGKPNYGFLSSLEEMKIIGIYIPTFEELCFTNAIEFKKKDNIKLIDIRKTYHLGDSIGIGDPRGIEILYSKYYYVTPKYQILMNHLIKQRETVIHYNDKIRMTRTKIQMAEAREKQNYFEVARLWVAADKFMNGLSGDECFYVTNFIESKFLWEVLEGKNIDFLEKAYSEIEEMENRAVDKNNIEAEILLKNTIMNMITLSLQKNLDIESLLEELTKSEREALIIILNQIPQEDSSNTFSIGNLSKEYSISRPIFRNTLRKLETYNIATITNKGAKGTSVRILDVRIYDILK